MNPCGDRGFAPPREYGERSARPRVFLSDSGGMLCSAPMESESVAPASARAVSLAADEPADYSDGARLLGWDIQTFALRSRFQAGLAGAQTAGAQLTRVRWGRCPHLTRRGAARRLCPRLLAANARGSRGSRGEELHDARTSAWSIQTADSSSIPRARTCCFPRHFPPTDGRDDLRALGTEPCGDGTTAPRSSSGIFGPALRRPRAGSPRMEALLVHSGVIPSSSRAGREIEERLLEDLLAAVAPPERPAPGCPLSPGGPKRGGVHPGALAGVDLGRRSLPSCGAAPERALRHGFAELYGVSPMVYLRSVRMHAARKELGRPECERSIADVALGCGFTHLGRFSVDYRRAFGQTPSATRREAHRGASCRVVAAGGRGDEQSRRTVER